MGPEIGYQILNLSKYFLIELFILDNNQIILKVCFFKQPGSSQACKKSWYKWILDKVSKND